MFVLKIHDMLVGGQDILGMYFVDLPVANCRQVRKQNDLYKREFHC